MPRVLPFTIKSFQSVLWSDRTFQSPVGFSSSTNTHCWSKNDFLCVPAPYLNWRCSISLKRSHYTSNLCFLWRSATTSLEVEGDPSILYLIITIGLCYERYLNDVSRLTAIMNIFDSLTAENCGTDLCLNKMALQPLGGIYFCSSFNSFVFTISLRFFYFLDNSIDQFSRCANRLPNTISGLRCLLLATVVN